jgi:glycogen debranching enzyme
MSSIENLRNRIDLTNIPFSDRGSRLLMFRRGDEVSIRLAERWVKWEQEVGHYRQRPPIIEHFTFLDEDGAPVNLREWESYPHLVRLATNQGWFDWTFIDPETLLVRLSVGRYGFQFIAHTERGQADRRGGLLHGKRNVAYTTNARIYYNTVTPTTNDLFEVKVMLEAQDGDCLLLNITPRLAFNRSLPLPSEAIEEARLRWQTWFDAIPPVPEQYRRQYEFAWWVMRSGLLNTRYFFTREALVPSKIHYVGVWHWDQFFHAVAYRHVDTHLAEDQIRIVLDHQRADGMLPDAIHDEGLVTHLTKPVDEDVTKPPLAAWSVVKLYEKSGHRDFLEEVYEPLTRWHQWWWTRCANGNGLAEYRHPFSSGLDDSPLWDYGMPVVAPDLNTYLCLSKECLAKIADLIGLPSEAARYRQGAEELVQQMIDALWDEEKGYFVALHNGEPIPVFTPFSLLPLCTGRLPATIEKRLLAHLTDPSTFWTEWPLPTVAKSDPKFDPMQMWRGPTWINVNYLFIEALARIGQHELSRQLRHKTLDLIMQHDDIYEYYHPLTAERPPKASPIFGWSCALFIDLAIQASQE